MGFPLLLNKALATIKKHGLDDGTKEGHVRSAQVGFPLLLNKKRKTDHQMNMTRQHEAIRMAKELKKEHK